MMTLDEQDGDFTRDAPSLPFHTNSVTESGSIFNR